MKPRAKWPEGVTGIRPHEMTAKVLHWPRCKHCGLVALRNDATRAKLREGCYVWADEQK